MSFYFLITVDIQYYIIFQVYKPVVRHLYNLWSDHPDKSSTHLTPHIIIAILLTIFSMLYFISPWIFCNYWFVYLNPFTFFTQPPETLLLSENQQNVPCNSMSLFLFCLFIYIGNCSTSGKCSPAPTWKSQWVWGSAGRTHAHEQVLPWGIRPALCLGCYETCFC